MDVSIIIVNYNTFPITKACIDSIINYTRDIKYEIILVDNNSQDESYNQFTKDKRINYLYQEKNLGFGKANNIGFKTAKGKYIFLLNSDTLIRSNVIKEFYDYMENADTTIACVGTILKSPNGEKANSYGHFPNFLTGFTEYSILSPIMNLLKLKKKTFNNENYVDYISGADIFLRRNVAEEHGLFDPDFFMYFEETEMQYRYQKHGYKSVIYDKPQIIHLEGVSMKKESGEKQFLKRHIFFNSYYLYLKKCYGNYKYYLFRLIYAIISPLWIIHPKFSFKDKINFISNAYQKL